LGTSHTCSRPPLLCLCLSPSLSPSHTHIHTHTHTHTETITLTHTQMKYSAYGKKKDMQSHVLSASSSAASPSPRASDRCPSRQASISLALHRPIAALVHAHHRSRR